MGGIPLATKIPVGMRKAIISRVKKKIVQRRTSSSGGGGSAAPPPSPSTQTQVEPTTEEIQQQEQVEQKLKELEGKPVAITYETPKGEIKTFQTVGFRQEIIPGQIINIRRIQPSGGYSQPVLERHGTSDYETARQQFKETKQVPEWYRKQVTPPDIIRELGIESKYFEYTYGSYIGAYKDDTAKQQNTIQQMIQRNMTPSVAEKYYTWDGKTWEQLKREEPSLYITGKGERLTVKQDIPRWQKEQHERAIKEQDYGYLFGEWYGQTFTPRRYEYAAASLFGTGTRHPVTGQIIKKPETFLKEGHYSMYQKYRKGDYLGIGIETVQSPIVFPVVASATLKGIGIGARAVAGGFKTTIARTPQIYAKISKTYPTVFDTTILEGGKVLRTPTSKFVSDIGRTSFYKNIYGWSTGSLTRVRTLPLVRPIKTRTLGEGVTRETRLYKGFGKVSWEPRTVAYQTPVGKTGYAGVSHLQTGEWFGEESIATFKTVSKPKGHLWWKKVTEQTISRSEFQPYTLESGRQIGGKGAADIWSGWTRPGTPTIAIRPRPTPVSPGLWKDTTAQMTLTHRTHIPVHHTGMLSRQLGTYAGSPYSITTPTTFIVPKVSGVTASIFGTGTVLSYRTNLDTTLKPRYEVEPIQFQIQPSISMTSQQTAQAQLQQSLSLQGILQSQKQFQVQMQGSMQKQKLAPSLSYATISKYRMAATPIPRYISQPMFRTPIPRPIIIPPLPDSTYGKTKQFKTISYGKGYRHRKWKVLKMEELIGGNY